MNMPFARPAGRLCLWLSLFAAWGWSAAASAAASCGVFGGWLLPGSDPVVITLMRNGTYMLTEVDEPRPGGQNGMERGTYSIDPSSGAFTVSVLQQMVDGGTPAGGFVDADFVAHAVHDLDGTSTAHTGTSIQRKDNNDTNT